MLVILCLLITLLNLTMSPAYGQGSQRESKVDEASEVRKILELTLKEGPKTPEFLRDVAILQARAGDFQGALRTADAISQIKIRGTLLDPKYFQDIVNFDKDKDQVRALTRIAVAQAKAGELAGARKTFERAVQIAEAMKDDTQVAKSMKEKFRWLRGDKAKVFSEIGIAQIEAGEIAGAKKPFQRAVQLFDAQKGAHAGEKYQKVSVFADIGKAYAKAGDLSASRAAFDQAIQIAKTIDKGAPQYGNALSVIVTAQTEGGDLQGVVGTTAAVQGDSNMAEALGRIGLARAKTGDRAGARMAFEQAIEIAAAGQHGISKALDLEEIGVAQAKAGEVDSAKRVFQEALQIALQIAEALENPYYSSHRFDIRRIAAALSEKGNKAAAREVLERVLKQAPTLKKGWFNSSEIALGLAEAGDTPGAMKVAAALPDDSGKAEVLRGIAVVQVKAGDIQGALQTAATINPTYNVGALSSVAVAQAEVGNVPGALQTAATIKDEWRKAQALAGIAAAQAKARDRDGARMTLKQALDAAAAIGWADRKAWALWEIAEAQAKVGDRESALSSLKQALQIATALGDGKMKIWYLVEIAVAHAKIGDVQGALAIVGSYRDEFEKEADSRSKARSPTPFMSMAMALAEARNFAGARQVLRAIEAFKDDLVRSIARREVLSSIAVAQAKAGDVRGAFQTAAEMETGWSKNDVFFQAIAEAQAEAGDWKGALRTAIAIIAMASRDDSLAEAQAKSGDLPGALHTLRLLSVERGRPVGSFRVALAQVGEGDIKGALQTAAAITDGYTRSRALGAIAAAQWKAGNHAGASETLQQALDTAKTQRDQYKTDAIVYIAEAQARAGAVEEARKIFPLIPNPRAQVHVLRGIAVAQAEAGDLERAFQTLKTISDSDEKEGTAWEIAKVSGKKANSQRILAWSAMEDNPYIKGAALRGLAEGMLERKGL